MIHDAVIESHGQWQWTLAVSGDVVTARVGIPYDGVLTYSTADKENRSDKNSVYQLEAREVVERYVEHSETERGVDDLLADVRAALDEHGDQDESSREEPTRSEPADFGGGETTGVQDL